MHGAVSVEPNYIEVHKLRYWIIHYIEMSVHCRSRKLGLEGRNVAGMGFYFLKDDIIEL